LSLRLDEIDLIKRLGEDSTFADIRAIHAINLLDRRNLIELHIPGSEGNMIQEMGSEPVEISIFGEMMGASALQILQRLRKKHAANKSFNISSDIAGIVDVNKVIMQEFYIEEFAGSVGRFRYHMLLKEFKDVQANSAQSPKQEEKSMKEIKKESDIVTLKGQILDVDSTNSSTAAKGLKVTVRGPDKEYTITTDDEGYYEITDAKEGEYEVLPDIKEEEFHPFEKPRVIIKKGEEPAEKENEEN